MAVVLRTILKSETQNLANFRRWGSNNSNGGDVDAGNLFERKKAVNNMSERLSRSCCDAVAASS